MISRRVLVTGASHGIGHAVVTRLAAAGHRPVGLARTRVAGFPGEFREVDLADREATQRALDAVLESGPVHAVVNNVGLVRPAYLPDVNLDDLHDVYDLNVRVAVQVTQAALPGMIAQRWGRIVNLSSLVTVGMPERTAYGAAKAALDFCTRAWAVELARTGLTVNSVAPGPTETEFFRENNPPGSPGEERYLSAVPAGRFGQPAEIAAAICFLLSEDAGFITGQTLRVDGGASAGCEPLRTGARGARMSLNEQEIQALSRITERLTSSAPRLGSLLMTFSQLASGQDMPCMRRSGRTGTVGARAGGGDGHVRNRGQWHAHRCRRLIPSITCGGRKNECRRSRNPGVCEKSGSDERRTCYASGTL